MNTLTEEEVSRLETVWALSEETPDDNMKIAQIFSMARRALEVEERLRKAVEASRKANESLSWLISQRFLDPETDNQRFYEALVALRYAKEVIEDRPKAIRPPAQCAPPDRDLNKSVININFSSSFLQGNAELVDGRWWFRYDTEDSTTQANEDVLRDLIAPELAEHGLELEDPCIEHDCISGFLKLRETCKHGTPFRYHCTDCEADDDAAMKSMRKGLDDHSCNSTGWEK